MIQIQLTREGELVIRDRERFVRSGRSVDHQPQRSETSAFLILLLAK